MNKIAAVFTLFIGICGASRTVMIEPGARLRVRTASVISAKITRPGEPFTATLEEPLRAGRTAVAPKGAEVAGVVTQSDATTIAVRLTEVETNRGPLAISTNVVISRALTSRKQEAMTIAWSTAIGAAIGALLGGGPGAAIGASAGAGAGAGLVSARRGAPPAIGTDTVLTFQTNKQVTSAT